MLSEQVAKRMIEMHALGFQCPHSGIKEPCIIIIMFDFVNHTFVFLPPDWLSLLLVACAAMFVFLLKMNYASFVRQCPVTSKHSILELFTGKYLALQYSKVVWDWDEPQVVGNIMTFRIKVPNY